MQRNSINALGDCENVIIRISHHSVCSVMVAHDLTPQPWLLKRLASVYNAIRKQSISSVKTG